MHSPAGNKITRVVTPAETVMAADGNGGFFFGPADGSKQMTLMQTDPVILKSPGSDEQAYSTTVVQRHLGFTNILYCDGHVKANTMDEFAQTKSMSWYPSQTGQIHYNLTVEDD